MQQNEELQDKVRRKKEKAVITLDLGFDNPKPILKQGPSETKKFVKFEVNGEVLSPKSESNDSISEPTKDLE